METNQRNKTTINSNFQAIKDYIQYFNTDCTSYNSEFSLTIQDELKKILCIGKQFMYFACPSKTDFDFIYITQSVKNVLGYDTHELSTKRLYELIHPTDRGMIIKATLKSIDIQKKLRSEPLKYVIHMNFRIKRKDGAYIKVLRQTSNYINDDKGLMSLSIAVVTDITHLKTNEGFNFYCTPDPDGFIFPDDELLSMTNHDSLTKREKQIIRMLEEGQSSKEIARQLSISKHTVDTHRGNILEKLSIKNTAELITYVKDYQIV